MTWLKQELATPQPDGVATAFTLSGPYVSGSLRVYAQGQKINSDCVIELDASAGAFALDLAEPASDGWTLDVVFIDPSAPVGVFADTLRVEIPSAPVHARIDMATVRADMLAFLELAAHMPQSTRRADMSAPILEVIIKC